MGRAGAGEAGGELAVDFGGEDDAADGVAEFAEFEFLGGDGLIVR